MNRHPIDIEEDRKMGRWFIGACAAFALGGITYCSMDHASRKPDENAVPLDNIVQVDVNGDGRFDTDVKGRGSKAGVHYMLQYDERGEPVLIPYAKEIDLTRPYEEQRGF